MARPPSQSNVPVNRPVGIVGTDSYGYTSYVKRHGR